MSKSKKSNEIANVKNSYIINEFEKLRKQIRFEMDRANKKERMKHSYRLQAIETVLQNLRKYPNEITSSKQLKGVKGIGKGSLDRLDEIIKTGKLSEIVPELINQDYLQYVQELANVFGIGDRMAFDLYKNYGVKTIEDLEKLYKEGKIHLPDQVVKGLKFYSMIQGNIPQQEIVEIDNYLHEVMLDIDPQLFGIIAGSYRRNSPTSGDIDVLLVHPNIKTINEKSQRASDNYLARFVNQLIDDGFIIESFTDPNVSTKYMGLCKWKDNPIRRIDIRFIPYNSYYTALLYFTGPANFNKNMRRLAISLGYSLSEYFLTDSEGKKIPINSEKDVFDKLGMEYLPPEKRK